MPNTEVKAMIIKILSGFDRRMEDIHETINTEIRNNKTDIKLNKQNEKYAWWN